jgi:hypothetical protein
MAHFAKVNNGVVINVIVAEPEFFDTFIDDSPGSWIQTSYNTRGGVHYQPDSDIPSEDQSKALRANYAGIGYVYNIENDVFHAPQPYPSWTISTPTWIWQPPVPMPADASSPGGHYYRWDEPTLSWVVIGDV